MVRLYFFLPLLRFTANEPHGCIIVNKLSNRLHFSLYVLIKPAEENGQQLLRKFMLPYRDGYYNKERLMVSELVLTCQMSILKRTYTNML